MDKSCPSVLKIQFTYASSFTFWLLHSSEFQLQPQLAMSKDEYFKASLGHYSSIQQPKKSFLKWRKILCWGISCISVSTCYLLFCHSASPGNIWLHSLYFPYHVITHLDKILLSLLLFWTAPALSVPSYDKCFSSSITFISFYDICSSMSTSFLYR